MRHLVAFMAALIWANSLPAAPFNPSRYTIVTATNHPSVFTLSWHLAMDGNFVVAAGEGPTNGQTRAFVLKRHHGGVDKWNILASYGNLNSSPSEVKVAIAGDVAVVADQRDSTVATNAGAVHVLLRNHPTADAWNLWKTIHAPHALPGARFGVNIATDGRYLAVAGYTTNGVYLFARDNGGADQWGLVKTFASQVTNESVKLSVDIDGDLLAVGDISIPTNHVVRMYERNAGAAEMWALTRTLAPADGQTTNRFGASVAIHGRVLAVGAPRASGDDGAIYVFERDQGGAGQWGQVATLPPDSGLGGWFGSSVAVHGDTVVGSSPYEAGLNPPQGGALYVFQRNAGGSNAWGRTARLLADPDTRFLGGNEPCGVAIEGDTIAAGNYWDFSLTGTGGLRVFTEYPCPSWSLLTRIVPTVAKTNDEFGTAIVIEESVIAAGRPGADVNATNEGGFASFERNAGGADAWNQVNLAGGGGPSATNARSGTAMAISPRYMIIGAPGRNGYGKIEIRGYTQGGGLDFQKQVDSPDQQPGGLFGASVATWDDLVLAGAPLNTNAGLSAGAAFMLARNQSGGDSWGVVQQLVPSPFPVTAEFGRSVALHRDIAAVGAPYEEDLVNGMGAVFIFQANRGGVNNWGQVRRIKVPDLGAPYLGWSVALWGDLLAVGAIGDDDEVADSGAVLLFQRNRGGADNWGLLTKIKAPSPQTGANFGWSLAIRGDRLIVGEPDRDGDFTDQGRVFVFERNQGGTDQWGLVDRINAPAPQFQARFGSAVALTSDRIAVGAPLEDVGTTNNAGVVYVFQPDCLRITTTNDVVSAVDGVTSLREAIGLANDATQGTFTVYIPAGTFVSSNSSSFTINNTSAKVILQGQGARRTMIDKQGSGRIFFFTSGTTGEVRDLTMKNGQAPHGASGSGTSNGAKGGDGGGALVSGDWTFLRCMIISNAAGNGGSAQTNQGTFVGLGGYGGGIHAQSGRLEIRDSTVSYNRAGNAGAPGDVGSGGGYGGGVATLTGAVFILNSTIYGNAAGEGSASSVDGNGGGLYGFGDVTIRHSTISHNSAGSVPNRGRGGGVYLSQPATIRFSVINNNNAVSGAPDADATFNSPIYNHISNTNGITITGSPLSNSVGVLAQLGGSPESCGGPTDTMFPQAGSPVIDKGDASVANVLTTDQRGYPRPTSGNTIDLGAVETQTDFDLDGIPDAWEQAYGTDAEEPADSAADLDGDTYDGLQEYVMDTNPYGSEPLAITLINQSGVASRVYFPSSSNRIYSLASATNMGAWIPVSSQQTVPGNGGTLELAHTNSAATTSYRISVEVP